jgi:hypothetical protein
LGRPQNHGLAEDCTGSGAASRWDARAAKIFGLDDEPLLFDLGSPSGILVLHSHSGDKVIDPLF